MKGDRPSTRSTKTKKRVVFATLPSNRDKQEVCPAMSLQVIRSCRRPLPKFLLNLLFCLLLVSTLVLVLINSDSEPYTPKDYMRYSQCDIIFLEVTIKPTLSPRQACSVESAAVAHPNASICLAMSMVDYSNIAVLKPTKEQFQNLENVFVIPLNYDSIFRWTPLEHWWREEFQFTTSIWRTIHLSDVTRLAFLWKYGGLYLDLDVIVLQPLLDLSSNFIGIQHFSSEDGVNTAVMRFERNHPFLSKWVYSVPSKFDENDRSSIGPLLVTKLIFPYCQGDLPDSKRQLKDLAGKSCDFDLRILPPGAFYPIPWAEWKSLFKGDSSSSPADSLFKLNRSLTLHTWNEFSSRLKLNQIHDRSVFKSLAKNRCPREYYRSMAAHPTGRPMNAERLKTILKWSQRAGPNNNVLAT
ncbi:hypothetical protein TCAL_04785 [Tigriopus californicus]|uniref:Alpha 1,4-glycosyltransferase domain-containing protein n=1 Tax=Tigriopus californicus TaxID=6832 RepID=A0A553PDD3_TIGCA|nr:alpha-1,4-N-acetylglucosaminyltransferase-like [Tigriopus californicus]TRY75690.1 hypothetical protein TCAL_04785 [Tigriopus californicus]|eukprot:TCALIF_04785-PA protein Name:"Similar to A4galt Lactosylceramide 4-alpha-galactosyltransferase (Mus musculus)" AED:0.04 eAED:0.06 QI:0/-1/0/1/-1/1/1/0/410